MSKKFVVAFLFVLALAAVALLSPVPVTASRPPFQLPPENDNFADAAIVHALPFGEARDINAATLEDGEPQPCASVFQTIWYSFTPTADITVIAHTVGSDFGNTHLNVYQSTGIGFDGLSFLGCASFDNPVIFYAQTGVTYYLQGGSLSSDGSILQVNLDVVPPVANDHVADAVPITELPFFHQQVDTRGATRTEDEPIGCFDDVTVWYTFTPNEETVIRATTTESSGFLGIDVYSGGPGDFQHITCHDLMVRFLASPGVTYYLMISGRGDLWLEVYGLGPPPPNDEITNATLVSGLPFSDRIDPHAATRSAEDPEGCYGGLGDNVWYTFTPDKTTRLKATTTESSSFVGGIDVFSGAPGSLSDVACGWPELVFQADPGVTYYFMISGGGDDLVFSLQEQVPPPNDEITNAETIPGLPFTAEVDMRTATRSPGDPEGCTWPPGSNVWYTFTPSQPAYIRASTGGDSWNQGIDVYTGAPGGLDPVACSSGTPIEFLVSPGTTYYFMVGGEGGNLLFSVESLGTPPDIQLSINPVGKVNPKTGAATIGGVVTCNQPTSVYINGWLRQKIGRKTIIRADYWHSFECNGETPWSVTLRSDQGAFGGGKAETYAHAYGCGLGCVDDEETLTIKLRASKK